MLLRAAAHTLATKHITRHNSNHLCTLLLRYAQSNLAARRWLAGCVPGFFNSVWVHAHRVLERAQEGDATQEDITVRLCVVCYCCLLLLFVLLGVYCCLLLLFVYCCLCVVVCVMVVCVGVIQLYKQ